MINAPDMRRIKRVLLIKLSSIGDVVHALPVSAALGRAFPHVQLTWIIEARAAPLLVGNPYLHDIMILPDDWHAHLLSGATLRRLWELWRDLRARHFDLALDLQGLTRSACVGWASGARWRFGWNFVRELAPLLVKPVPRRPTSVHVADQLLDVARFLGARVDAAEFPLHVPARVAIEAEQLLAEVGIGPGEPFLAINPTDGGNGNKGVDVNRLLALLPLIADNVRLPVVLIGGPADRVVGEILVARGHPQPASLIGRTNLQQLMAVLRRAWLHLSGDTGSGHIAAALGTPVVSIFGRTNPARSAPYGQGCRVVQRRDQCAPVCGRYHATGPLNGIHPCFRLPSACLAAITPTQILDAICAVPPPARCSDRRAAG